MVSFITRTSSDIHSSSTCFNNTLVQTTPLFGTDGIRGRVGDLLSAPLALQVGYWAGVVLRNHSCGSGAVILGQDSRNSSDMLAMALSAGLTAAGIEVWYLGLCPTPGVAYLTANTNAIGGVMISASHNPPEDNGIKIFASNGAKLPQNLQAEIEAGISSVTSATIGASSNCGQHYSRPELIADYAQALKTPLDNLVSLQGMKVVLDLAWGAAVGLAPSVFREMGAEVICLHNVADGSRINVNCGSTHLDILAQVVKQENADLGFAFDGDADRVLAVDNTGRQVNGDYILYLWGQSLQHKQQLPENLIVSTVMANLGFERAWEQLGGKFIRTAVGDQHVQAEMFRTGGMLGGEQSGHILCRHYAITGDGLLTALHLAALVKESGVNLSQMIDESFATYPQVLRNVRVEDRAKRLEWKDCQLLQDAIARASVAMGNTGRVLVRASGTEPVIRVMVEAHEVEVTNYWIDNLVKAVQEYAVA